MSIQSEIINRILDKNSRDIYKKPAEFIQELDEIISYGKINKEWKKLFYHLTKSKYYNVFNKNPHILLKFIDLLDDKISLYQLEIKKIYNLIYDNFNYYNDGIQTINQIMLRILEKGYIYNDIHLCFLIKINEVNPINKFEKYIIEYLNKKSIDTIYNNHENKIYVFFDIIFSDIFRKNILLNNENILLFLVKCGNDDWIFNIEVLTSYIYKKYIVRDKKIPMIINSLNPNKNENILQNIVDNINEIQ
jgi:hypothetical protein